MWSDHARVYFISCPTRVLYVLCTTRANSRHTVIIYTYYIIPYAYM